MISTDCHPCGILLPVISASAFKISGNFFIKSTFGTALIKAWQELDNFPKQRMNQNLLLKIQRKRLLLFSFNTLEFCKLLQSYLHAIISLVLLHS